MLKISAVYLIGKAEIPIHYTMWALVEQALLNLEGKIQVQNLKEGKNNKYVYPNSKIIKVVNFLSGFLSVRF